MLKSDLHTHADTDDHHKLKHTSKQLIDHASKLGFEVLSITNHNVLRHTKDLARYAKQKNILLLPGTELEIDGKEVILLNINQDHIKKIKTFEDLETYKDENILVMAPHPFYPGHRSLFSKFTKNHKLFDAVEYCHFYPSWFKFFNDRAVKAAKMYNLPLIGTSDAHLLSQMNRTFSFVDSDKKIDSFLEAIRKNRVKIQTEPIPVNELVRIFFRLVR